ncbi:putative acyl-CoA thioester hydrolase [Mangrovibacter phragmitis]|uniref:putative acyl-CoA thioester hydrolase n=1 Tax=Mangrovibacter phragmitis TaxID=1691903 RepID=UPI00351208EF
MNTLSVSRLALALAFGLTLTACKSVPPQDRPSEQVAPGSQSRPVLSADEAQNFVPSRYFSSMTPSAQPWKPTGITLPAQADFVVGPAGTPGVTQNTIQSAVDAAMARHASHRLYIAIMPGDYQEAVYIPAAPGSLTLYGTGAKPADVKIGLALDARMDKATWRKTLNPAGQFMPGKSAWYMYQNCLNQRGAEMGIMCSAAVWSQNSGLQLQNLTIQNTLGDSVDAGNHEAVALRSDGDQVQINNVNILGRQNTFFVTNSDVNNRMMTTGQPRTLVTNSYIEGDVDLVSGRGAVVFENTRFNVVNSRTQKEGYVFAPATLPDIYYGFLALNSEFNAAGDGVAQLGRAWDLGAENGYVPGQSANGQVVIRDSVINAGFNTAHPWGTAKDSQRPFAGNTGSEQDKKWVRNLNDVNFNRMWEFNNRGLGSKVVLNTKK